MKIRSLLSIAAATMMVAAPAMASAHKHAPKAKVAKVAKKTKTTTTAAK